MGLCLCVFPQTGVRPAGSRVILVLSSSYFRKKPIGVESSQSQGSKQRSLQDLLTSSYLN